jgi:hypothetical protein
MMCAALSRAGVCSISEYRNQFVAPTLLVISLQTLKLAGPGLYSQEPAPAVPLEGVRPPDLTEAGLSMPYVKEPSSGSTASTRAAESRRPEKRSRQRVQASARTSLDCVGITLSNSRISLIIKAPGIGG